jgi:PAS domain S-box-containing protein
MAKEGRTVQLSASGFMPHGMCYLWQPGILGLHIVSDSLITLAYFSIPFTLIYFTTKRTDLRFSWVFISFAVFIVACGASHAMEIVTIWIPAYWLSGIIKAVTALASVMTGIFLVKLVPTVLELPSPSVLKAANVELAREVAERKRAEAAIREINDSLEARVAERTAALEAANRNLLQEILVRTQSEELLAVTLASIRDGVIVTDVAEQITFINEAATQLIGCDSADARGVPLRSVFKIVGSSKRAPLEELIGPGARIGSAHEDELVARSGRHIPIDLRVAPIQSGAADIRGIVLTFRDFTERQRIQNELQKTNDRFAIASDAAGLGFWDFDVASKTLQWDAWMYRLYGRAPSNNDRPYSLWMESIHPEDRETCQQAFGDALNGTRKFDMEFRVVHLNGQIRHLKASSGVIRDATGRAVQMFGVNFDITERKRAAEQLRLAIEAAPTGMIMTDDKGKIVLVNAEVEKLFGYPRSELFGEHIEMLVPERFRKLHAGFRQGFYSESKSRPMGPDRELFGLCKSGREVPIEIGLNPLQTPEGSFVLSSVIDITERKRGVEQLRLLNSELERRIATRTSELKERESMLQEIHHRVKNNLQVIASLINMQVRSISDVATRIALQQCRSRVETMAQIHEMLYQAKNYANVPFSRYARELTLRILSASGISRADIELRFQLDELALPVEKAIPCGLILNELVANSLKHAFPNDANGEILVELRRVAGHKAVLSVSDNGIGISPRYDPEKSNSLGIQLVLTLVQQLEAQLEIIRQPGATFRITFAVEPSE